MFKRGLTTCIFGTLSFIAGVHVFEAFIAVFFNKEIVLLKLYPFIGSLNIVSLNYLIVSLIVTTVLLAVTLRLAFSSPLENYLNMILSDANKMNEDSCELVEDNRTVLDMICESITSMSQVVGQTKDITYNVRSEVANLRQMPSAIEKLDSEIETMKKEIMSLKKSFKKPISCPSCGSAVLERFKICPYCGESLRLSPEQVIVNKL